MKFSIQYIYDGFSKSFEMDFPSEEDAEEFCSFEQSRLNAAGSDVSVVLQRLGICFDLAACGISGK